MSSINETGLAALMRKIKSLFFAKQDGVQTSELGIDSTPTSGSTNLVTSGGVFSALSRKVSEPSNEGTTGQVLTKTASGTEWADAAGGSGHTVYLVVDARNALWNEGAYIRFDTGFLFTPPFGIFDPDAVGRVNFKKKFGDEFDDWSWNYATIIPIPNVHSIVGFFNKNVNDPMEIFGLDGYELGDGTGVPKGDDINYPIMQDCYLVPKFTCLMFDTLILMANGETKRICDIGVGDMVMSVNPETGNLEADRVTFADGMQNKHHNIKDIWTFSDGTVVETVHRHRFYNTELGEMMYMQAWETGEHAHRSDGDRPHLVSHKQEQGDFWHCTIFTEKWNNYFAGGLLCGNRRSSVLKL